MRNVTVDGVEFVLDCNAFTPFVYAEEFTTVNKNGKTVPKDINAGVEEVMAFLDEHGLPPMLELQRLFWALAKTANPKVPSFKNWLRSLPPKALSFTEENGWAEAVMEEIKEAFFPAVVKPNVAPETSEA